MPTFSLTFDNGLVIHGDRQAGWCAMPGWQIPGAVARISYASPSPFLHGDVATSWTCQQGILSGDVLPVADDAADLTALTASLRAALGRLSYEVTTEWNGEEQSWACDPGSMTPSPLTYVSVSRNEPVYSLSIPCYPLAVS